VAAGRDRRPARSRWDPRAAIDRDRYEAKLREAEATYRSIVETTPAITYQEHVSNTYQEHVSKEYDVGGSVIHVSPQVERILGYSARDWAETPAFWEGIVHPDDRDAVVRESERTGRSGEPYQ
jgi:PAS domain S-box-containing protein